MPRRGLILDLIGSEAISVPRSVWPKRFSSIENLGNQSHAPPSDAHQSGALHPAFCSKASPTLRFTRLLKKFTASHLFLDATPFNKFSEASNRLLNALAIANRQFDHDSLCVKLV